MATSAPLAAPICFRSGITPLAASTSTSTNTSANVRDWKRSRPSRPGVGPALNGENVATDDDLDHFWGQGSILDSEPAQSPIRSNTKPTACGQVRATSMISWDQQDVEDSLCASYIPNESESEVGVTNANSWHRSVSSAPFSHADLVFPVSAGLLANRARSGTPSERLGPVAGEMVAVGLSDGSTVLYQSRTASPSRDSNLLAPPVAQGSTHVQSKTNDGDFLEVSEQDLFSTRPSSVRSSSRISFTREASPGMHLLPSEASHSSLAISNMSFSTTSSTPAALHVDDSAGAAATIAIETNVNAVGESVKSPTRGAEHELEAQKAAADRNDHKHSMIGRTVEALGFASTQHRGHASHESISTSKGAAPHGSGAGTGSSSGRSSIDTRRRSVQQQLNTAQAGGTRKGHGRMEGANTSTLSPGSQQEHSRSSQAFATNELDPRQGSGHERGLAGDSEAMLPLLRLTDADQSAVVALRLYREGAPGPDGRLCLLAIHREGRISSWSLRDGESIWSIDVAKTKWTSEALAREDGVVEELKEAASTLAPFDALAPMFSHLSTSMSRAASASSRSVRGTSTDLKGGTAQGEAKLPDGNAVWLTPDVQVLSAHGRVLSAVWDASAGALILIDLDVGRVVGYEELPSILASCTPLVDLVSAKGYTIEWIEAADGKGTLRSRLVTLAGAKAQPAEPSAKEGAASTETKDIEEASPEAIGVDIAQHNRFNLGLRYILGLNSSGLTVWQREGKQQMSAIRVPINGIKDVVAFNPAQRRVLVRTADGLTSCFLDQPEKEIKTPISALAEVMVRAPSAILEEAAGSGDVLLASHDDQGSLQLIRADWMTGRHTELSANIHGPQSRADSSAGITSVLPLSLERMVVARQSGSIQCLSLSDLARNALPTPGPSNSLGTNKTVVLLRQASSPRTASKLIVGGTAQGDVAFWDASTYELMATWSIATSPIEALITFGDEDNTLRLHGCLACVAADSSVSVILLDGLRLLYSVPGREARLRSLAVRADELLLLYDDSRARVWDLRSRELRRSIGTDQAQALVLDGKGWWTIREIEPFSARNTGTSGVLSTLSCARGAHAAALLADFRRSIDVASRAILGPQKQGSVYGSTRRGPPKGLTQGSSAADFDEDAPLIISMHTPAARKALGILRPLLASVLPIGVCRDWDQKVTVLLDAQSKPNGQAQPTTADAGNTPLCHLGLGGPDSLAQPLCTGASELWTVSSLINTQRALISLAMLKIVAHIQELTDAAASLSDAILDGVHASVGAERFKDFSLPSLSLFFLDSNAALREAARQLFAVSLSRMPQDRIEQLCKTWQPQLPVNQPPVMSAVAPAALSLLGHIAVARYKAMSPTLLKQISQSITVLLASEGEPVHQSIAIDLCSAGFSIWQHYLDATNVVRTLFALSTDSSASSIGGGNSSSSGSAGATSQSTTPSYLRALARSATLQIASENTPLFMTTLSIDILNARSPAHCSATMKLVAFMVRKRPEVLYPNLPRLAEAVVKSLDPRQQRDTVLSSATLMISELVSTYPSIAFHERSQRLAVGTHEGAVILYDLKTATRLFVLEGHRAAVSGVEFSADGRRLVTVSEREGLLCIWKVGVGILGFLTPGAAPKQGGAGEGRAYREYRVPPTDDDDDEGGSLLPRTTLEWPGERTLRVTVGESTMNISVD